MKKFLSTYTGLIILINVIFFILSLIFLSIFGEGFLNLIALQPAALFSGKNLWTIITSMFTHITWWHILANMVSLFFIGTLTERLIGKKRFLALYFASGIFAGLFYAVLAFFFGNSLIGERIFGNPLTLALGASGALFGLLGLLAVLIPHNKVYLITGPIIAIIIQLILTGFLSSSLIMNIIDFLVLFYIFFTMYAIFSFNHSLQRFILPLEMPFWLLPIIAIIPLIIIGLIFPLPIGNTAHLGGLLIGLGYGFYLKYKYPRKTRMISRYFLK